MGDDNTEAPPQTKTALKKIIRLKLNTALSKFCTYIKTVYKLGNLSTN